MFVPGQEELVISSMLDQLGIGLYQADGTAIRVGTETSDADFYMFEDEAYGLVAMLRAYTDQWMDFRDFHAALAEFGVEGTPEELIQAYADAYAEAPDLPMTKFVQAQAFLDVEAQIPPLGVWLLFLDGLVPPNGTSQALASLAGGVAALPGRNGIAHGNVQRLRGGQAAAKATAEARLLAMSANLTVELQPASVHEGHGGPGAASIITAAVRHFANSSPFSGLLSLQACTGDLNGISVTWDYGQILPDHGTPSVAAGANNPTDIRGVSNMTYTPQAEAANGRGHVMRNTVSISATAPKSDVIHRLCGAQMAARLSGFLGRPNRGSLTS